MSSTPSAFAAKAPSASNISEDTVSISLPAEPFTISLVKSSKSITSPKSRTTFVWQVSFIAKKEAKSVAAAGAVGPQAVIAAGQVITGSSVSTNKVNGTASTQSVPSVSTM